MICKLRYPFAVFALALSALGSAAQAQFSAYAQFTVDRMTGVGSSPILQTLSPLPCASISAATASCTSYSDHVNPSGFTGGISYDVKTYGPVTLGIDLRGSTVSTHQGAQYYSEGSGAHIYSGLGGIRATFNTPKTYLKPYVQGSVGYARSNFGILTDAVHNATSYPSTAFPGVPTQNAIQYNAFAGLDLRLLPYASWRVVEAGYGALQATGTYSHSYPVYSISTGIVFHFSTRP